MIHANGSTVLKGAKIIQKLNYAYIINHACAKHRTAQFAPPCHNDYCQLSKPMSQSSPEKCKNNPKTQFIMNESHSLCMTQTPSIL